MHEKNNIPTADQISKLEKLGYLSGTRSGFALNWTSTKEKVLNSLSPFILKSQVENSLEPSTSRIKPTKKQF